MSESSHLQFVDTNIILFWDAMIVASAIQLGCQIIWSDDLNPGQVYNTVTVTNPF